MKKRITRLVSFLLLASAVAGNLNAQGCLREVNLVVNPDFSGGLTGFTSGIPFDPTNCMDNGHMVGVNFTSKCLSWTAATDHTTGTGQFLIVDGPNGGGAVNVWQEVVNVCPNTTYTFSYWGRNQYSINLFPVNFVINGVVTPAANLTGGAWTQYSTTWNSGAAPPPSITIALSIPSGHSYRDFGIDDIYFGYCNNLAVTPATTICSGSCVTLTATGAAHYIWSTGATTASIVVCPSTTTTYTVSGTDATGCLNYGSTLTTVTVNPFPITVTAPAPVCVGGCATLTASGATTYTWMPGGLTGSSVSVCPTVATTYTVTGTAGSCIGTATVLVTMAPTPTITATASPSTLTPPSATTSFITTTATGGTGFSYSWLPATGLSSTTVSNPVATPTVTTTYTVTVTNSAGCTSSTTVTVNVAAQSLCTLPYAYTVNGGNASTAFPAMSGLTGQNIKISGVFTIDVSFNFSQCNIVMEPNSRIEVGPGALLIIGAQTHIYACDSMWDGINLQSGSTAQIINASIIEDAVAAVTINQGSSALIDNSIFNRNYTAVKLTTNTSATSPVDMKGCVVTCRNLLLNANPALNPNSVTVWSNIVAGTFYSSINLKWPYYAYKSIYGVQATDVNALQIGNDAGVTIFNGFDNVSAAGIHLTRSNAIIYNNKFRTITSATNCVSCTPLIGTGVYAIGNTTTNYQVKIGGLLANQPNDFYNINTSIDINQYNTTVVMRNTLYNVSSTIALFGGYGKVGMRVTPNANNTVKITENTLTNCATGILVNRNNATAIQNVNLTINTNVIDAVLPGYCTTAIYVTDPASGVTLIPTISEINYNTITRAVTCISLLNVNSKNTVYFNSCMTIYAATSGRNGIKLVNCSNNTIQLNHTKYNTGTVGVNTLAYGIFLQNSPSNLVLCNTIEDATRSLVFSGNCTATHGIKQNTMRRGVDGIVLLTTATLIGTQGTAAAPSNNYWDMTVPFVKQIVNVSTTAVTLVVTTGGPVAAVTQPTISTGLVSISTTAVTLTPCIAVPARMASTEQETRNVEVALNAITVFPNPNNGQFTINTNSDAPKDVMVYDMNGRIVFTMLQTTENTIAVDISNEAKGLYVVKVSDGTQVHTARVSNQ